MILLLTRTQYVMGTLLYVGVVPERYVDSVFALARRLDSLWRPFWEGWVSEGETLTVPYETDLVLLESMKWREKTGGRFDPFYRSPGKVPVRLEENLWYFPKGTVFDPGGIAKGVFFRLLLEKFKFDSAFINFGGSGIYSSHEVEVSVVSPDGTPLGDVNLKDGFLFVSSTTRTQDTTPHIYDPLKGKVVRGRIVCAVKARDPVVADVLSTLCVITGGSVKGLVPESTDVRVFKGF